MNFAKKKIVGSFQYAYSHVSVYECCRICLLVLLGYFSVMGWRQYVPSKRRYTPEVSTLHALEYF
jgi:hypothetical protein